MANRRRIAGSDRQVMKMPGGGGGWIAVHRMQPRRGGRPQLDREGVEPPGQTGAMRLEKRLFAGPTKKKGPPPLPRRERTPDRDLVRTEKPFDDRAEIAAPAVHGLDIDADFPLPRDRQKRVISGMRQVEEKRRGGLARRQSRLALSAALEPERGRIQPQIFAENDAPPAMGDDEIERRARRMKTPGAAPFIRVERPFELLSARAPATQIDLPKMKLGGGKHRAASSNGNLPAGGDHSLLLNNVASPSR